MIKTENWCGYNMRFVEIDGEWWAILKDICDALGLRSDKIASRLEPHMLERVLVEASNVHSKDLRSDHLSRVDRSDIPLMDARSKDYSNDVEYEHKPIKSINKGIIGKDIGRRPGENKTRWMLAVNEIGIYEALFASRRLEARKFRMWSASVMQKLRKRVGLEGYEVMSMTEKSLQDDIDHILDDIFYDEESGRLMMSVTVAGGDVDQVPLEDCL